MLLVLALLPACAGAAADQALVRPDGSPVALSVPVEYAQSPTDLEGVSGVDLTRPGASAEDRSQPVGRILHRRLEPDVVQRLARRDLRLFSQGLDPFVVSQSQPGALQVLAYDEIDEADWWGSRIRLIVAVGEGDDVVVERMVLVGRDHGDLVEVEFSCNSGCFGTFEEEIDEIVSSWTTEDQP